MKTTVKNIKCTTFTFEDIEVYLIDDSETARIYKKDIDNDETIAFVFGVKSKDIGSIDIEALYKNGYFEEGE